VSVVAARSRSCLAEASFHVSPRGRLVTEPGSKHQQESKNDQQDMPACLLVSRGEAVKGVVMHSICKLPLVATDMQQVS